MANQNSTNRYSQGRKSEFEQKMVDLRRVARVIAGGRRFSFRATVIIGDQKGRVGIGIGKGTDTALAIGKAARKARKNLISVPLTKDARSIPFEVEAKYGAGHVRMRPQRSGSGLVAGGVVRTILNLAGVQNTSAKILSHTKNKINNARAVMEALKKLRTAKI
jgi:small subunit ribosomal protein S5